MINRTLVHSSLTYSCTGKLCSNVPIDVSVQAEAPAITWYGVL